MTLTGRRALIGVRVSVMRDDDVDKVSPEQQYESCYAYANDERMEVSDDRCFQDLDVSASIAPEARPGLGPWITTRVHEWDILLVTKNDRLFRSTYDFVVFAKWLEKNKKAMHYVEQGLKLDFRGEADPLKAAADKMFMIMMTIFAEIELNNIKDRFRKAHAYLRSTNRFSGGLPPMGYRVEKHPEGGSILVVDVETSEIVKKMAGMALAGKSNWEIARWLNSEGFITQRKRWGKNPEKAGIGLWTGTAVGDVLRSPSCMGLRLTSTTSEKYGNSLPSRKRRTLVRDASGVPIQMADPLFEDAEWFALQAALDKRSIKPERSKDAAPLLGVAMCGGCGSRLYRNIARREGGYTYYRCQARHEKPACPGYYFNETELHEILDRQFVADLGDEQRMREVFKKGADHTRELAVIDRLIGELEEEQDMGYFEGRRDTYMTRMSNLLERRKACAALPQRPDRWVKEPTGETYAQAYQRMTLEERRQLLLGLNICLICHPRDITLRIPFELKDLANRLPALRVVQSA